MPSLESNALEPTKDDLKGLPLGPRLIRLAPTYGLVILMVLLIVLFSILLPDTFPTRLNLRAILSDKSIIALLSLAQTVSFEVCQPVASIANLTATGCDRELQSRALSDNDLAYLRALYSVDPHDSLIQQQGKIALEMKKILGARASDLHVNSVT